MPPKSVTICVVCATGIFGICAALGQGTGDETVEHHCLEAEVVHRVVEFGATAQEVHAADSETTKRVFHRPWPVDATPQRIERAGSPASLCAPPRSDSRGCPIFHGR